LCKAAIAWLLSADFKRRNFLQMPRATLFGGFHTHRMVCALIQPGLLFADHLLDPFMTRSHHELQLHSNFRCLQTLFPFRCFPPSCKPRLSQTVLPVGVCLLHVKMESLSDTLWDVVISGTGLQQSLLAL
jgi:hypothetical protein